MNQRLVAAGYFAVQSGAGLAWWVAMFLDPAIASLFFPAGAGEDFMRLFVVADLALFVVGSGVLAIAIAQRRRHAQPLAWFVLGAVVYATLCCAGLMMIGGD